MGGHLAKIETCPSGVTWGIGIDKTPWVYSGAFGGGFFKGNELFKVSWSFSQSIIDN